MTLKFLFFVGIFTSLIANTTQEKSKELNNLEHQVYVLNNQFKYTESQQVITQFINEKANTDEDLVYAHIFLSHTYKRLYDYVTTLAILQKAKKYATQSTHNKKLTAIVNAELAFSLFDTEKYEKSLQLIELLKKDGFKYNTLENKSKLLMQLAYIDFLNKNYLESEFGYNNCITLMQQVSPCDLPMIYAKLMPLYNATKQPDRLQKALTSSLRYADSCNILKYKIYTYEEYYKILKKNNNITESFKISTLLDSLNTLYSVNENIVKLHLKKQEDLQKTEIAVTKKNSTLRTILYVLATFLIVLTVFLLLSGTARRKLKKALGFYEEKYNDLWADYQISNQKLTQIKAELLSKPNDTNSNMLNGLLKDLTTHVNNDTDNEHKHINILKEKFIKSVNKKSNYLNSQEQLILFFFSLHLSHKKIGEVLNKTEKSIDSYKYRIGQKIKSNHNMSIAEYLNTVNI